MSNQQQPFPLPWIEPQHHPVLEVVSHVTSPLSAALSIWSMQKFWQSPALKAALISGLTISRAKFRASRPLVFRSTSSAFRMTNVPSSKRTYSTYTSSQFSIPSSLKYRINNPFRPMSTPIVATSSASVTASTLTSAPPPPFQVEQVSSVHSGLVDIISSDNALLHSLQQIYNHADATLVYHHISTLWPVLKVQELLELAHSVSGLPWWATIMCATIVSRVLVMPINISSLRNSLRLKRILPQVVQLEAEMTKSTSADQKLHAAQALQQLFRQHRCNPLAHLWVPFVFPAAFLSYFGAVHNLCLVDATMANEGTLWFVNLMVADPTFLLPVLSSLTWLWTMELGGGTLYHSWPGLKTLTRTIAMASIPIVSTLPSGVFMFWIPANLYAVVRSYIVQSNTIRQWLAIPTVDEVRHLPHLPRPVPEAWWPPPPQSIFPAPKNVPLP